MGAGEILSLIAAIVVLTVLITRLLDERTRSNSLIYDQLMARHQIRDIETQTIRQMLHAADEAADGEAIEATATDVSDYYQS